jgi:hypothetical protein
MMKTMKTTKTMKTVTLGVALALGGLRPAMAQVPAATPGAGGKAIGQQPILRSLDDEAEPTPQQGKWSAMIQEDLLAEKFDELDRMATTYRRGRVRMVGGGWRLDSFYAALNPEMATEKDTADHLARLERWTKQRPESITARVAYANSLIRWAWVARGNGSGLSVTAEGARLFEERIAKARQVLEGAATMRPMCPQWFAETMTVGLAQGWDEAKMREVFERGIELEPDYFYLHKQFANYLLPKWEGKPGDASRFAKESADTRGGDAGDILYLQIARECISRHNGNFPVQEMDWQRIQQGYSALKAKYGATPALENHLAFMAWKYKDAEVAKRQFAIVGDRWNKNVWGNRQRFEKARGWAEARG